MMRALRGIRAGRAGLCAVVLHTAGASVGSSQEASRVPAPIHGDRPAWSVVYDHAADRVELRRADGEVVERWSRADALGEFPLLAVPSDRPVRVVVENANRLLYDYGVSADVVRESDATQCRDLGSEFVRRGLSLHLGAVGGLPSELPDVGDFLSGEFSPEMFLDRSRGESASLSRNDLRRVLEGARAPVLRFVDFTMRADRLGRSLGDSLRLVAQLAESRPADSLLAALQSRIAARTPGLDGPGDVAALFQARIADVGPFAAAVSGAASALQKGTYSGRPDDPEAADVLDLHGSLVAALSRADSASLALQNGLLDIARARAGSRIVYTLAPSPHYRAVEIVLEPSDDPRFSGIPRLRQSVAVYTEPRVGLVCRFSVGMAWMDRVPEYEGAAGLVRRTPSSDDTRTTASLLMHLSHPALPWAAAVAGLGVGSEGGPDFYVGGSLQLFEPLMVNAGWVWQRTPRLPEGLALGSPLTDPAVLDDLSRSYARSVFFGVSLAR